MKRAFRFATVLVSLSIATFVGCKSGGNAGTAPVSTYSRIDLATAGTVAGVVHFAGVAPKRVEIDMAQDPACAMTGGVNLSEPVIVNDGKLANAYVYVTLSGKAVYAPASVPVVLDQKGCRYLPHVIAAQAGQPVEFRNSDPTMHNIHMEPQVGGNQAVDISQPPMGGTSGAGTQRLVFNKPEAMIPVRCNNHPWMQAYINIADNPFFAVSDAGGHYVIAGLPPGTYTLTAVHEQMGTMKATVTVTSHGTTQSDFHFDAVAATGAKLQ